MHLESLIPYILLLGLFLPIVLLLYNNGFKSANRYLSGFLFFASLYVLESFTFFYVSNPQIVAIFTNTHFFFYLIGPFAYLYVRSTLKDDSSLNRSDILHFLLFFISITGYLVYIFTPWSYKLMVADNIISENWDMQQFHLNTIIPHKVDQLLNVLQVYFYSIALWYLLWKYKRKAGVKVMAEVQYKLVKRWLFIITAFMSVITLNFTYAMSNMWMYDSKSVFLEKASIALFIAAVIYVLMNMTVMFFPHILYGIPIELKNRNIISQETSVLDEEVSDVEANEILKNESPNVVTVEGPQLFSVAYIETINNVLDKIVESGAYLKSGFGLSSITETEDLPSHHLTYYFNNILNVSFSQWKNNLRIAHAKKLIELGANSQLTLSGIAEKCGYTTQSTFIRAFKQETGKTPSEYIKKG